MLTRLARKPLTWIIAVVVIAGLGFGAYWFQPWKAFTDTTVNESLPDIPPAASDAPSGDASDAAEEPVPTLLAEGDFITQEHDTSGTAQLVEQADGSVVLAISDLATSDGPDLRVWLTDQSVDPDEWSVFDDGYWVELGKLKGNKGDQLYEVPADAELDKVTSVSIWCKRFSVSFGAATLK